MTTQLLPLVVFGGATTLLAALLFAARDLLFARPKELGLRDVVYTIPSPAHAQRISSFDAWFDRSVYLAGLGQVAARLLPLLVALALGAAAWVITNDILVTLLVGAIGVALMLGWLEFSRQRAIKQFETEFPTAMDLLARAVRSGESLDQAIATVGDAIPGVVGREFRRCARQLGMGLSVSAALQAFAYRVNLLDVRLFASTVALHRERGGSLPMTLERLAEVVRHRSDYRSQLKNVTGASRFSVMLIALMGPILFAYLFLIQPEYGRALWEDPWGRTMLIVAIVSQLCGLLWVSRLLKPTM